MIEPTCMNDFLFSDATEREKLELILSRQLPFPLAGKSGVLLHGTFGTGKSTLAQLLPRLLETAYEGDWNMAQGVGDMPAVAESDVHSVVFSCGDSKGSTQIAKTIDARNGRMPLMHSSKHDYFVFDEVDRLTALAQQTLRSKMDLKRCMFFFTTNYLDRVDEGIINRCHLVEMNQARSLSAYLPVGHSILRKMGVASGVVLDTTLLGYAKAARGSLRNYCIDVVVEGVKNGGCAQV